MSIFKNLLAATAIVNVAFAGTAYSSDVASVVTSIQLVTSVTFVDPPAASSSTHCNTLTVTEVAPPSTVTVVAPPPGASGTDILESSKSDGMTIQTNDSLVYMVFNKPRGVVSTMEDPEGRPCISDFLKNKNKNERLFHVGRLDAETEGLLLLTNDGELTNRLTHPSYEVPKTYLVQVRGPMGQGIGAQMKAGIELEDGLAKVDSFKLVDSTPGHVLIEVVLHSGKNRIVRRLFDAVGFPVLRLVRVKVGPIGLGDQRQGSIRNLGKQEVGHLLASVGL